MDAWYVEFSGKHVRLTKGRDNEKADGGWKKKDGKRSYAVPAQNDLTYEPMIVVFPLQNRPT